MEEGILDLETFAEAFETGSDAVRACADSTLQRVAGGGGGESRAARIKHQRVTQALRVLQDADRLLCQAGIAERILNMKAFSQILDRASCESDEKLFAQWAGLLASSATRGSIHASHPHSLAELGSAEVQLLDVMYQWYLDHQPEGADPPQGMGPLSHGFSTWTLKECMGLAGDEFRIRMTNVLRLGLCIAEEQPRAGYRDIFLTPLGFDFARHCRGPAKPARERARPT